MSGANPPAVGERHPPPPRRNTTVVVVANPYLRRGTSSSTAPKSTTTTARSSSSASMLPSVGGTARRRPAFDDDENAKPSASGGGGMTSATIASSASKIATTTIASRSIVPLSSTRVTPTPKKRRTMNGNDDGYSIANNTGSTSTRTTTKIEGGGVVCRPNDVSSHDTATRARRKDDVVRHPIPRTNPDPIPRNNGGGGGGRTPSLKTSLKSQIAELQRKKKLFLQKKVDEERRVLLEKEREGRRMKMEEEARRIASMKEAVRIENERISRKKEVERCLNDAIMIVERRMSYEARNPGVHYAVGEALEYAISTVEDRVRREEEERRAARRLSAKRKRLERSAARIMMEEEVARRRRAYEVGMCLHDVVNAVVAGTTTCENAKDANATNATNNATTATTSTFSNHVSMTHNPTTTYGGYPHPHHNTIMTAMATAIPSSASYYPQPMTTGAYAGIVLGHRTESHNYPIIDHTRGTSSHHVHAAIPGHHPSAGYHRPIAYHPYGGGAFPSHPPGVVHRMPAYPSSSSSTVSSSMMVHTASTKAHTLASSPAVLHPRPISDPHSPYGKTHVAHPAEICITKKGASDRFGVSLRYESRSALVPRDADSDVISTIDAMPPPADSSSIAATTIKRKTRRKRVGYGVVAVVDATAAAYANADNPLRPGDVVLSINGISVGVGSMHTFSDAARAMADSSPACAITGIVRCRLTVARANVAVVHRPLVAIVSGPGPIVVPTHAPPPLALPLIPFRALGDGAKISGEFSTVEWRALVRGLSNVPHRLFSGALISVTQQETLVAILKSDEYGGPLRRRGVEALEAKLAHESKRLASEMRRKAERHWANEWKAESEESADRPDEDGDAPTTMVALTDARRSHLRWGARPARGCKCGSLSHDYVSDPSCPLYRDVRRYCELNSIDIKGATNRVSVDETRKALKKTTTRIKSSLEMAYVDRFVKLRAENSATREEAEFVLEMETIQTSMMKKAVLAPPSLCTLILSAVASVMDKLEGAQITGELGTKMEPRSSNSKRPPLESNSDDSDGSDDDDLPLNTLLQKGAKRMVPNGKSPPSKRPRSSDSKVIEKRAPHPYCMAEILNHVSLCHGHLFEEPTHADFAWQQRHRSTLTTPLPKEVMFKGNPRTPGTLSFENIRFMLNDELMTRLRNSWERSAHNHDDDAVEINDEWIVSHLSSETLTGLRHEIDVMLSLEILTVKATGELVLAENWYERVPHMILNEVKYAWGSKVDVDNLFCVHDKIKSKLEGHWEQDEYGWRVAMNNVDDDDDDELVFEDEEYQLREQIFRENYSNWVSASLGMGEFGV